jgi:hypothetical protein
MKHRRWKTALEFSNAQPRHRNVATKRRLESSNEIVNTLHTSKDSLGQPSCASTIKEYSNGVP